MAANRKVNRAAIPDTVAASVMVDPDDTLGLTPIEQRALEREVLQRLRARTTQVTLADLFLGFRPRWAGEALLRCHSGGLVDSDVDERGVVVWEVTDPNPERRKRAC